LMQRSVWGRRRPTRGATLAGIWHFGWRGRTLPGSGLRSQENRSHTLTHGERDEAHLDIGHRRSRCRGRGPGIDVGLRP
jgi:hypothetical protein